MSLLDPAILQRRGPEVQQQANLLPRKAQVSENLGLMQGIQTLHCLGFHHDQIIHEQIDFVGVADQQSLEAEVRRPRSIPCAPFAGESGRGILCMAFHRVPPQGHPGHGWQSPGWNGSIRHEGLCPGFPPWFAPPYWGADNAERFPDPGQRHGPGGRRRSQGRQGQSDSPGPRHGRGGAVTHRLACGRAAPMAAEHAVLRPAKRVGPGRCGSARKPWLRGDAKAAALISPVSSAMKIGVTC